MDFEKYEFQEIDLNSESESSTDEETNELRIRHWLLDAAICQFSQVTFLPKRRVYLPDSVFIAPGINEEDLLQFLTARGASKRCIRYAMLKYHEARNFDDNSFSDISGQYSDDTMLTGSGLLSEGKHRRSALEFFLIQWKRLKQLFKRSSE